MKWIVTACLALFLAWFVGAYMHERPHLERARDWISEGTRMTNAIEVFRADRGRCPTNLSELFPQYYAPSNQSGLGWSMILECAEYSGGSNTFDLKLPFERE